MTQRRLRRRQWRHAPVCIVGALLVVMLSACGGAGQKNVYAGTPTALSSSQIKTFQFDGKSKFTLTTANPTQVYAELLNAGGYYVGRASSGTVMWDEYRAGSNPTYAANLQTEGLKTTHALDFSKQPGIRNGLDYQLKVTIFTPKSPDQIRAIVTATPAAVGDVQAVSNQTVYVVPITGGGAYSRPDRISCLVGCS